MPARVLGAVDAITGADEPWAASNPVADYGATSNLTSLTADATQVYGAGYYYTYGGNFEGRFAMNPDTGAIIWMNSCHGDSYATFPIGQVLYSASHEHECSDIGAFSQTTPSPIPALHHFGEAETTYATGTLHPAIFTVGGGPTYYNFGGQPSGTQLNWYPTFAEGTYTGQSQAAWSVSGNSKYISYGGEFPTVNGTKQQGLVRFAISSIAPNKVGPTGLVAPTVVSQSSGTARIGWEAASDQDNTTLTYAVTRDSSTTPIYTTTVNSTFYNRPALSYVDKNQTPGINPFLQGAGHGSVRQHGSVSGDQRDDQLDDCRSVHRERSRKRPNRFLASVRTGRQRACLRQRRWCRPHDGRSRNLRRCRPACRHQRGLLPRRPNHSRDVRSAGNPGDRRCSRRARQGHLLRRRRWQRTASKRG